jgi:hypothetical protein
MYEDGRGVQQDDTQAVAWWRKAAEQGNAKAQCGLGVAYASGRGGVQKDYMQAVAWFRKAAEQGDANAQLGLGFMYENGLGVQKDTTQAIAWYQKAADQGDEKAKNNLAALQNLSSSSIEIFGVHLKNATRANVRAAFKKTPLKAERESDQYWVDLYHSSKALEGSSQLAMGYTRQGQFAYAEYTFPSRMDTQQVRKIADMVAAKYGKPDSSTGDVGLGEVEVTWQNDNDVTITVYRGWPDTTTYLRFSDADAEKQMNSEIEDTKNAQTREKAKSQSHAF